MTHRTTRCGRAGFGMVGLLLTIAVVAVAGLCGVFVAMALTSNVPSGPPTSIADERLEEPTGGDIEYVEFGAATVNLAEARLTRYLRVNITLQVAADASGTVKALTSETQKALFQNWLITYLSDKRLDEVKGTASINRLRREVQDGFNALLAEQGQRGIEGVLFTEYNVQ